jgi:hypothetical protein
VGSYGTAEAVPFQGEFELTHYGKAAWKEGFVSPRYNSEKAMESSGVGPDGQFRWIV